MRLVILITALTGLLLTGCATAPNPAEVCTAEWIKPRAESAVKDIEKNTSRVLESLGKSANSYEQGKTPGPIELYKLSRNVDRLTKELKSGQGIRDLRMLRDTCNDPDLVSESLTDIMRDNGLPDRLIEFIQNLDVYQRLIAEGAV